MPADAWMPTEVQSMTPADDAFFTTADFVLPATVELPHSPAQVWDALSDDRLGAWMAIIDLPAGLTQLHADVEPEGRSGSCDW